MDSLKSGKLSFPAFSTLIRATICQPLDLKVVALLTGPYELLVESYACQTCYLIFHEFARSALGIGPAGLDELIIIDGYIVACGE